MYKGNEPLIWSFSQVRYNFLYVFLLLFSYYITIT